MRLLFLRREQVPCTEVDILLSHVFSISPEQTNISIGALSLLTAEDDMAQHHSSLELESGARVEGCILQHDGDRSL